MLLRGHEDDTFTDPAALRKRPCAWCSCGRDAMVPPIVAQKVRVTPSATWMGVRWTVDTDESDRVGKGGSIGASDSARNSFRAGTGSVHEVAAAHAAARAAEDPRRGKSGGLGEESIEEGRHCCAILRDCGGCPRKEDHVSDDDQVNI